MVVVCICQSQQCCAFGFVDIYYIQVVGNVLGGIWIVLDVSVVQIWEPLCCLLTAPGLLSAVLVGFIKGPSD